MPQNNTYTEPPIEELRTNQKELESKFDQYYTKWLVLKNDTAESFAEIIRDLRGFQGHYKINLKKIEDDYNFTKEFFYHTKSSNIVKENWITEDDIQLVLESLKSAFYTQFVPKHSILTSAPISNPNATQEERDAILPPEFIEFQKDYNEKINKIEKLFANWKEFYVQIRDAKKAEPKLLKYYKIYEHKILEIILIQIPIILQNVQPVASALEDTKFPPDLKRKFIACFSKYNSLKAIENFDRLGFLNDILTLEEAIENYGGDQISGEFKIPQAFLNHFISLTTNCTAIVNCSEFFVKGIQIYNQRILDVLKVGQEMWIKKLEKFIDMAPSEIIRTELTFIKDTFQFKVSSLELSLPQFEHKMKRVMSLINTDSTEGKRLYKGLDISWNIYHEALLSPLLIGKLISINKETIYTPSSQIANPNASTPANRAPNL